MVELSTLNGESFVEMDSRELALRIQQMLESYGIKLDVRESGMSEAN